MARSIQTAPFLLGQADRLVGDVWSCQRDEPTDAVHLPDWDPSEDLRFVRTVQLDASALRRDAGLPPDCLLRLGVVWRSPSTLARGTGTVVDVTGERIDAVLVVEVAGRLLSDALELMTVVVLGETQASRPIVAWRAGSILWEEEHTVSLAQGSRFPLQSIAFRGWQWPAGAIWRLEWDPSDLHAPVLGGLCVYLNADHPRHEDLVGPSASPASRAVRSTLYHDVARSLIRGALDHDEFLSEDVSYPNRSVGQVVRRILRTGFRGYSLRQLREEMRQAPAVFEARLQDGLSLFGDCE